MLSIPFLLIWVETAASYFIGFWCMLSVMFLMRSLSLDCGKEANKKLSSLYFSLYFGPSEELVEYEFQAYICGRVQLQCPKTELLILKYNFCSFLTNVVLKISGKSPLLNLKWGDTFVSGQPYHSQGCMCVGGRFAVRRPFENCTPPAWLSTCQMKVSFGARAVSAFSSG